MVLRDSRSRWALGGVGEWIDVFDAELQGAVGYSIEDVFGAGFEVSAGSDVVFEGGPVM